MENGPEPNFQVRNKLVRCFKMEFSFQRSHRSLTKSCSWTENRLFNSNLFCIYLFNIMCFPWCPNAIKFILQVVFKDGYRLNRDLTRCYITDPEKKVTMATQTMTPCLDMSPLLQVRPCFLSVDFVYILMSKRVINVIIYSSFIYLLENPWSQGGS